MAKLAITLGCKFELAPSDTVEKAGTALFRHDDWGWLETRVAHMVMIECVAQDKSADEVLAGVKQYLAKKHFPTGRPSDARGIGEGHVDDE